MSLQWNKLCSEPLLLAAWKAVRGKGSVGGIDGVSLAEFEKGVHKQLPSLLDDLRTGTWKPQPYVQIEVPKRKNSDEMRLLGMATIRDKIVLQAIKMVIEGRCERLFSSNSYAYRPDKGATKAIRRILFELKNKKWNVVLKLDIDNFFDNIDHQILLRRLTAIGIDSEIIRLIMLSIKMGKVNQDTGEWIQDEKGVPQSSVLSPLLSNLYLTSFDQFAVTNMVPYLRYADDFIYLCENHDAAEGLLLRTKNHLEKKLGLSLNPPLIKPINEGFDFLGVTIKDAIVSVSPEKKKELIERIKTLEINEDGWDRKSHKIWRGFYNYYAKILPQDSLEGFDEALIRSLSTFIADKAKLFHSKTRLKYALGNIQFLSKKFELTRNNYIEELLSIFVNQKQAGQQEDDSEKNRRIVLERKKEYRRLEAEANSLLVSKPGLFVGLTNRGVTVKEKGVVVSTCREDNLSHIVITGKGVSLSSNLMEYCLRKNIPIDFFDNKGKHIGSILNARVIECTLWKKQAMMENTMRNRLSFAIIEGKIKNQFSLVKYFHKYHKNHYPNLAEKMDFMKEAVNKFKSFKKDADEEANDYISKLVGHEAQIAIRYWDYIRELVADDDIGFTRREHHGATDLMNCMLNYGYAILYVRIWQALLAAKLNPFDSFIHVRHEGNPTLVYDMVEIFRSQVVDRIVISLIQKGYELEIVKGLLSEETRKLLAKSIMERLSRYEKYQGIEMKMEKIISLQAILLGKAIDKGEKFKCYVAKW